MDFLDQINSMLYYWSHYIEDYTIIIACILLLVGLAMWREPRKTGENQATNKIDFCAL